jgi:hypothetical protein
MVQKSVAYPVPLIRGLKILLKKREREGLGATYTFLVS